LVRIIGTEKAGGYSQKTVIVRPGALAANANCALPTWAKGAWDLVELYTFLGSDGTAAASMVAKTKVAKGTAAPGAGNACLYDADNLRIGDALTTRDMVVAVLEYPTFTKEV